MQIFCGTTFYSVKNCNLQIGENIYSEINANNQEIHFEVLCVCKMKMYIEKVQLIQLILSDQSNFSADVTNNFLVLSSNCY